MRPAQIPTLRRRICPPNRVIAAAKAPVSVPALFLGNPAGDLRASLSETGPKKPVAASPWRQTKRLLSPGMSSARPPSLLPRLCSLCGVSRGMTGLFCSGDDEAGRPGIRSSAAAADVIISSPRARRSVLVSPVRPSLRRGSDESWEAVRPPDGRPGPPRLLSTRPRSDPGPAEPVSSGGGSAPRPPATRG